MAATAMEKTVRMTQEGAMQQEDLRAWSTAGPRRLQKPMSLMWQEDQETWAGSLPRALKMMRSLMQEGVVETDNSSTGEVRLDLLQR